MEQRECLLDALVQVKGALLQFQFAGFDFGKIENVIDEREQGFPAGADDLHLLMLLAGERGFQEQAGEANHPVEGRADLVAHGGEEIALRAAGLFGGAGHLVGAGDGLLQLGVGFGQVAVGGLRDVLRLLEFLLGVPPLGDVLHGAEDLRGLAIGVEDDFAAGVEDAHVAIRMHGAIGVGERLMILEGLLDDPAAGFLVVGMHPKNKRVVGDAKGLRGETTQPEHLIGPTRRVRGEIPVPATHASDALGLGELRLALAEFFLGLTALSDVLHDAEHFHGPIIFVIHHFAGGEQQAEPSVLVEAAEFPLKGPAFAQRLLHGFLAKRVVLGMHNREAEFARERAGPGRQPVNAEQLLGPGDDVRRDVPVPAPDMRDALGFRELGPALAQLRRGFLQPLRVAAGLDHFPA